MHGTLDSALRRTLQHDTVKKVDQEMGQMKLQDDTAQTIANPSLESHIYGDTLAPDEFRLACLSAMSTDDGDYPLHVSLEVYNDRNCPEYETVSYTWGGEDGDYSLSRLIFVGPYWDVLFQTKNCWDMLRFVQPWRGTRMVWVDALCINQGNIKERGQQVAKMGQIYERCLRVIVYLGSDLVLTQPEGQFPTRCRLAELGNGTVIPTLPEGHRLGNTPFSLSALLGRQYFSRVWVIQELLLSPGAVIRVGDVDFWTDSVPWPDTRTEAETEQSIQWASTSAPWVQHLAQKMFPVKDLVEVLQITSSSRASDPRDRVYGLLSLLHILDDIGEDGWQPDYSLSPQHVFVGVFAHCIANLGRFDFLLLAAGLEAPSSSPSWLPDWSSQKSWQRLFNDIDALFDDEEAYAKAAELHDGTIRNLPIECWLRELNGRWVNRAVIERPWNKDIAVCTETGGLAVNLTHFCTIPVQPECVAELNSPAIFRVNGRNRGFYLASQSRLDTIVQPGHDHVFFLLSDSQPPLYFILRETQVPSTYQLVAACKLLGVYPEFEGGGYGSQLGSVHHRMSYAIKKLNKNVGSHLQSLFPRAGEGWNLLPLMKSLQAEPSKSTPAFESAYLSCIPERFQPRIMNGYIEMSMPLGDSDHYPSRELDVEILVDEGYREYRGVSVGFEWLKWNTWTPVTDKHPDRMPLLAKGKFIVRAPMTVVRECCDIWFENLQAVQRVLGVDYQELEALLREGPQNEHHFIACPHLLEQIAWEDFALKVYTNQVLIV